jgi:hypothetical protein
MRPSSTRAENGEPVQAAASPAGKVSRWLLNSRRRPSLAAARRDDVDGRLAADHAALRRRAAQESSIRAASACVSPGISLGVATSAAHSDSSSIGLPYAFG